MGIKLKDIWAKISASADYPAFYRTTDEFHHGVQIRTQIGGDELLMVDEAVQKSVFGVRSREDVQRQGLALFGAVVAEHDPDPIWGAHVRYCRKSQLATRQLARQHQTNTWMKEFERFMSDPQTTEDQKFSGVAEQYYIFKQETEEDPEGGKMDLKALKDRWPQYMPAGFDMKRRI